MNKPIYDFFEKDHRRLDDILAEATKEPGNIDMDLYHEFRVGLLKHIKMEEKILFPAAQKANGGTPLPMQAQLRLEHGAITSLMVVPPTKELIKAIIHLIEIHDRKEEESGGMYDVCERLTSKETEEIFEQLSNATEVPVHPHNKAEYALQAAIRSLARAGYDYEEMIK